MVTNDTTTRNLVYHSVYEPLQYYTTLREEILTTLQELYKLTLVDAQAISSMVYIRYCNLNNPRPAGVEGAGW